MTESLLVKANFRQRGAEWFLVLRDGDELVIVKDDDLYLVGLRSDDDSFISPGTTVEQVLRWCGEQGYLPGDPPPRLAKNKYGDLK